MKNITKIFFQLILIVCFVFIAQFVFAQHLQERIDSILGKIETIKTYSSIRMKVLFKQIQIAKDKNYAKLEEGEFVFLPDKVLINSSVYNSTNLEDCQKLKNSHIEEVISRTIIVPGQTYTQSGNVDQENVFSVITPIDTIFNEHPLFVLYFLEVNLRFCKEAISKNDKLSTMMPTRLKLEDNSSIDRYEIFGLNSETADNLLQLDFPLNKENSLPIFIAGGLLLKKNNKSFWNWTIALKPNENSPLGYSEYEYTTYKVNRGKIKDEQRFINDPDSFVKKNLTSHITILNTPIINGTVFPEEFHFRIPKGKAMIINDGKPGSEPQRIVSEEDRIFTP